jgi:hypothetical protein
LRSIRQAFNSLIPSTSGSQLLHTRARPNSLRCNFLGHIALNEVGAVVGYGSSSFVTNVHVGFEPKVTYDLSNATSTTSDAQIMAQPVSSVSVELLLDLVKRCCLVDLECTKVR